MFASIFVYLYMTFYVMPESAPTARHPSRAGRQSKRTQMKQLKCFFCLHKDTPRVKNAICKQVIGREYQKTKHACGSELINLQSVIEHCRWGPKEQKCRLPLDLVMGTMTSRILA